MTHLPNLMENTFEQIPINSICELRIPHSTKRYTTQETHKDVHMNNIMAVDDAK